MASKLDTLMGRMNDLEHTDPVKTLFTILFGPPGVGKTVLAYGLAQTIKGDGTILHVDTGENFVSLEDWDALKTDVTRLQVTDSKDMAVLADAVLARKHPKLKNVSVVIIDEHSSLASDVLEQVVRDRAGVAPSDEMPEIEGRDYGPHGAIVMSFTKKLQKSPDLHVILVSHSREKEDKRRGTSIFPQYPPLLLNELQKLSHVTAFVSARVDGKGDYKRTIQAKPTATIQAKTRISAMPLVTDPVEFVGIVSGWINSGTISEELLNPEPNEEVPEGELPYDGDPIDADEPLGGSDDDAPIIVSE